MNVIKKYWDYVYIYVLLLVPGLCVCAGLLWTVLKVMGYYEDVCWYQIVMFDSTHILYLTIAIYMIVKNRHNSSFIAEHLNWVKWFIIAILFLQYNFILYLFPTVHVWECTFIFISCIAFLFDSKLLMLNIIMYFLSLLVFHFANPFGFLPAEREAMIEVLIYRVLMYVLTSICIMVIVYFVERFLMQSWENKSENARLLRKQLKYYKDMELMDMEIRRFRHDIKNHFICMKALLDSGKIDELQEYFNELDQSFSSQKKMYYSGNDVVDAILNCELTHNCDERVEVAVYGELPKMQTVSAIDMCTIFSNMLSNAVAAANQCATGEKAQITVRFSSGGKYFSVYMINSVSEKRLEGDAEDIEDIENKDRNHGHGLNKIKSVLEKYNGRYEQTMANGAMSITIYLPI